MPVQDNDDKRTADQPAVDAEEELRRKQAQAQEHQQDESGAQKSSKLLPFLNAKAEHHQSRIDSLDEKIANQTDKIDRNKAKIEALSAKADKLEDTNRMLKATIGNLPGIRTLIANNEKRIQAIREVKIPKRQEKIDQGWKKIDTLTAKRDRIEHKLNRVIALNDTIKSFGIHFNKERREAFADAMTRLNSSTVDCLSDKKATLEAKKQAILDTYNAPETSAVDKLKLGEQLKGVNERIGALESKIMKLSRPETHYEEQTNDQLDASMKLTGDKLGEMVQNGTSENQSNIRSIEQFLRFHPKVIAGRLLRGRSILDKHFHEFENVLLTVLFADVSKRIVVHTFRKVDRVEHLDLVRFINRDISAIFVFEIVSLIVPAVHNFSVNSFRAAPFKHLTALHKHRAFRIGYNIAAVHLHQVRLHEKSCLT